MSLKGEVLENAAAEASPSDFETVFRLHFERIARVLARVIGDRACAEELAVDVFLKLWRKPQAQGERVGGWLYRTAVRKGLDELRRRGRRLRYEGLLRGNRSAPTPEEIHAANEQQEKVRRVLTAIPRREAELLILHSHGLSYGELAAALDLNPVSVGKFLGRARLTFRKEYVKLHGKQ